MNSCCTNIISLGCFSSCDSIRTGIIAPISGTWTAKVSFQGVTLEKQFEAISGEEISAPNGWPEDLLLTMRLVKPDGTLFDDNCYSFRNEIMIPV